MRLVDPLPEGVAACVADLEAPGDRDSVFALLPVLETEGDIVYVGEPVLVREDVWDSEGVVVPELETEIEGLSDHSAELDACGELVYDAEAVPDLVCDTDHVLIAVSEPEKVLHAVEEAQDVCVAVEDKVKL